MRFNLFVFAGVLTLTIFNTYANATPGKMSSLDNAGQLQASVWCGGYSEQGCQNRCHSGGYRVHFCIEGYVQILSYEFDVALTCKP